MPKSPEKQLRKEYDEMIMEMSKLDIALESGSDV